DVPDGLARTRLFASDRPMSKHGEEGCETEVFDALEKICAVADEAGVAMAELALAWALQQPGITSLLVGARNPDEVQWNLPSVDLILSEDILKRLSEITEGVKDKLGNNPDMWMSESRMR
ncbi:MAG: aldo/keto reductase, partial [Gemmatimonadetes bacterium]|nr:aldo/keto reductase [Gemmatimonadota bacterium]